MRRSDAIRQILPYVEITNGQIAIGDRPHGMPRKVFAPMARKILAMKPEALTAMGAVVTAICPGFEIVIVAGGYQAIRGDRRGPVRKTEKGAIGALEKGLTK